MVGGGWWLKDRLGANISDLNALAWIDSKFLLSDSFSFDLITKDNEFAVERHACNLADRGDEDSVLQRQRTVESVGIRQELRSPPWVSQWPSLGVDNKFQALHWGTLFESTKRAWAADTKKANDILQATLASKITSVKLYSRNLTRDAAKFLVDYGNKFNEHATSTTVLEIWRSTFQVEQGWLKKKGAMGWTSTSLGQGPLYDLFGKFGTPVFKHL